MNLLSIENAFKTKKQGWVLWEIMLCVILVLLFVGGILYKATEMKNSASRTAAYTDMQNIKTLIVTYAGLRKDGQPPATLEVLTENPSISASDAIDETNHGAFLDLNKRKSNNGSVLDPWGNQYEYAVNSDGTGSITSTAGGGSNKEIVVEF